MGSDGEAEWGEGFTHYLKSNISDLIEGAAVFAITVKGLVQIVPAEKFAGKKTDEERNITACYFTEPSIDSELTGEVIDCKAAGAT